MGSYCSLDFDDLHVDGWKSSVPDVMISLFQENERNVFKDEEYPDEGWSKTVYRASREDVLLRLDVMGITFERAKQAFANWLTAERDMYAEWIAGGSDFANDTYEAIKRFDFDEWMRRAPEILKTRYDTDRDDDDDDETTKRLKDNSYDESWLFFATEDRRFIYRLLLEACPLVFRV